MAAQQPARTSPELRARLHSARANVGITPRPGALPINVRTAYCRTPTFETGRFLIVVSRAKKLVPVMGRVASITGQARSTLTRENGQPTDSNLAQPSSVILLRARTPICASVF